MGRPGRSGAAPPGRPLGLAGGGLPEHRQGGVRVLSVMVVAHAAACMATASRALDWTLGRRPPPMRQLWGLGVLTAVVAVVAIALAEHGPAGEDVDAAALGVFVGVQAFGVGALALGVHDRRRRVMALVAGFAVGGGLVAFAVGLSWSGALVSGGVLLLAGAFLAATAVFSVWLLKAVYALDDAKETRARLAVAEERLRFGRDLHDVMGRNLAVIALKSELAVQLSRRGRPEAVEQMIEAQRIAQESQREVRDVVRGYREVELAGARGVLSAAGIVAEVTGGTAGLPAEVQSALGWVVREATTNVLRHGDAKRVAVAVRKSEGRVVLTVENDGVLDGTGPSGDADAPAGTGGSGLAGLRERLSVVDGTLEAGTVRKGVFRVTAEVPLPPHTPAAREVAS
ncbi:sensor histidine kinase [Streptomyces sp. NPDC049936]|uniref:sensor histidine kinase n=1 Tax=Streptomyces sp. NPDC049936 TaxID=3365599 RepID=UPI00379FEB6A